MSCFFSSSKNQTIRLKGGTCSGTTCMDKINRCQTCSRHWYGWVDLVRPTLFLCSYLHIYLTIISGYSTCGALTA